MNIFTYDITKNINNVLDQTGIFTFPEFFRTWTGNPKADNPKSDKKLYLCLLVPKGVLYTKQMC